MIKVFRAKKERRGRDKKRQRAILQIGKIFIHLTQDECNKLVDKLEALAKTYKIRRRIDNGTDD